VTSLLNKFIWNSFIVAIVALFFIWLIALIIGVFSATKQHSLFDKLVTIGIFAAMSFPSFFIGLFLIKVFAVDLKLLPIGGMIDVGSN
ncbi:diguanylate cyclase, partial [Escherichia coli]|nr:diguanylate cyclase [Escherichia coli]